MFQPTSNLNIVVRSYLVYIFCMYTVRDLEKEYYHQNLQANSATETDRISLHFGFTNNQTSLGSFGFSFSCQTAWTRARVVTGEGAKVEGALVTEQVQAEVTAGTAISYNSD